MSAHQLWIAFGTTPCKAAGHRLRTRKGHCVQCNSACLEFLRRYDLDGTVYIAYAASKRLVKIGCADCWQSRQSSLNADGYAGAHDWQMKRIVTCPEAARVELSVHRRLRAFRRQVRYFRFSTSSYVWAQEVFRCSIQAATAALQDAISDS
jgi:hypothetical protein